jgi:hypothetical protein
MERLSICGLIVAAGLVVVAAINATHGIAPFDKRVGVMGLGGAFVAAIAWTLARIPTLDQTAVYIDGIADTRDRFLTAHKFSKIGMPTALEKIAMQECAHFISAFDIKQHSQFRFPRQVPWLLVPLITVALLSWNATLSRKFAAAGTGGDAATMRQARQLEKIAQNIDASKSNSEDLKKIADEIRKGEKKMQGAKSEDAQKTAMQETSSLEEMIHEMLNPRKGPTPEEVAVLAASLKQSELTKDAATALETGKINEAAEILERLLQQQKADAQLDKAGRDIRQAMSHLAPDQKGELGKELEQAKSGSQALQQLAENLRKAANSPQAQNGSTSDSREAMQKALSDLQNMKYGEGQDGENQAAMTDDSQNGKDGSVILMQSSGSGAPQTQKMTATDIPSGKPGSEHDAGTTNNPYGQQQQKSETAPVSGQVAGVKGAGASLHEFISATGDTSRASRDYRDLYNSMLPAAEDAIEQENIPLGSRFYIKRYFQSIRPKQ